MVAYALVIIDMQYKFTSARNAGVRKEIIRQIEMAKDKKCPIVFVEMDTYGKTLPSLKEAAIGTTTTTVTKCFTNGAEEVALRCKQLRFNTKFIRLVGIQTEVCVADTAKGLSNRGFFVDLVKKGCYSGFIPNSNKFIDEFVKKNPLIKAI